MAFLDSATGGLSVGGAGNIGINRDGAPGLNVKTWGLLHPGFGIDKPGILDRSPPLMIIICLPELVGPLPWAGLGK